MKHGEKLEREGLDYISKFFFEIFLSMLILLLSAGTIAVSLAWDYFYLTVLSSLVTVIVVCVKNPRVLNSRNTPFKHNTKKWDKAIIAIYTACDAIFINVAAGLDIGRFHWLELPFPCTAIGFVLLIASSCLLCLAMVHNEYFEVTARIQFERDQRVIQAGPYSFIRHPGYLSMMMNAFVMPLFVRSGAALAFSAAMSILVLLRTKLEDDMLIEELPGYSEYAHRVRYRLLPFVW